MAVKKCLYCGKEYEAKTKRSRYCSDLCRSRARTAGFVIAEPPRKGFSEESVAREVAGLHGTASFFDSASQRGPENCRETCRVISAGIMRVLKEAGF